MTKRRPRGRNTARASLVMRTRRHQARIFVLQHLIEHHCVDCGEADPRCLTFDHIDPTTKKGHVSQMMGKGMAISTIHAEIEKCEIRCSNCHAKKTSDQLSFYKSMPEYAEWAPNISAERYPADEITAAERGFTRKSVNTKKCPRCNEKKPISDFHARNDRVVGVQSWCKGCKKDQSGMPV